MTRIPWFDRKRPSLRPDLPSAERRAQVLSRMPHSGTGDSRREASWTGRARRYNQNQGTKTAPMLRGTVPQILLVHWWEVLTAA